MLYLRKMYVRVCCVTPGKRAYYTGPLHRGHMHTMWARSAGVGAETATLVWMQIYVADGGGHSLGHTDARQQDTVQLNA